MNRGDAGRGLHGRESCLDGDSRRDRALPGQPVAVRRHAPRLPRRPGGVRRLARGRGRRPRRRRRARARRVRGRARSGARAEPRKLAPATIARKLAAVRSFLRFTLGAVAGPRRPARAAAPRRLPDAPKADEVDAELELARLAATRSRSGTARSPSSSTRPDSAAGRPSTSTSATSTSTRSSSTSAARAARSASSRSARRPRTGSRATLRDARPTSRAARENALFLSARGKRLDTSALRAPRSPPPPPAPRVRDAPARGRRRPAHDPGAARPQLAVDDPDLQPRRRPPPPEGL